MKNKNRLIRIVGTIDEEAFKQFSERLCELECESSKPITIELSSYGGVAYDALAFSGRMRNSPCHIIVNAYGIVASAAVLVLASGDERNLAKEAWVMVHEDSAKLKGNVMELEREARQLRRMETQWAELLELMTTTMASDWEQMHKETTYLTAKDCLMHGLVDMLI